MLYLCCTGLHTYGQPDTRAMNTKNILLERRFEEEGGASSSDATDGKKLRGTNSSLTNKAKRRPQSSKEPSWRPTSARDKDNERGNDEEDGAAEKQKPSSASAYRNEFFNRRIVLDSKRRSFLQHALDKNAGVTKGNASSNNPKALPRAATHSGFYSNRDTKGEISTRPKSSTTPRTYRPVTPKYGREAESQVNADSRKNVLEMFDVIFDPTSERPNGRISSAGTAATPLYVPKESFGPPVPTTNSNPNDTPNQKAEPTKLQNGHLLNRRVAWSAPPKRREERAIRAAAATANPENNNHPSRESQSVTPRSGTHHLTVSANAHRPRPNSHIPRSSRDLRTDSPSESPRHHSPRPQTAHRSQVSQRHASHPPQGQQNGHNDLNSDHKESRVFTRRVVTQQELDIRAQRQKALGHMMSFVGTAAKQRPKTAPQPNYELMRRSVAAPRQQVG